MNNKDIYINETKKRLTGKAQDILVNQINLYYDICNYNLPKNKYKIGDSVLLKKGTLLHGTYKNIDGLIEILKDGLISSWFIAGRKSKYPSSVGVWNLKKDYKLKDYINFYSGGTIKYYNQIGNKSETEVIEFNKIKDLMNRIKSKGYLVWNMEQTKEARFLPSLVQDIVQVGIIFNGESKEIKRLLKGDILNPKTINDVDVKEFVNEAYYDRFIVDRKKKDDFFTDRESAVLFGVPKNFIEGVLVGRKYEKDKAMLEKLKKLLPNCYICNLDGKVIL